MKGVEKLKSPDQKLIQKASKGNQKALEQLIMKHHEQMYRTAFMHVRNKEDALDIVQEATYQALVSNHTLKNPDYFMAWLTSIIIRCAGQILEKKTACR